MSDWKSLLLDMVFTVLLAFIKSVYVPPPPTAQTFLPSLGDVITTPVTQVTVSAGGIVGAVDQLQWSSPHTEQSVVQLQSKKRGQSLRIS